MTHRNPRPLRMLTAATLALTLAGPTLAASEGQGSAGSSKAEPVTDAQLEKFAEAYGEIRSVRAEYAPKIRNAEDKQERAKLKKEGQQDMVSAIEDAGLKVAQYKQIGQRLNGDKELQARLQKIVQEQQSAQQDDSGQQ